MYWGSTGRARVKAGLLGSEEVAINSEREALNARYGEWILLKVKHEHTNQGDPEFLSLSGLQPRGHLLRKCPWIPYPAKP